jgi:tetratricopeptide (TPR) repeat protein
MHDAQGYALSTQNAEAARLFNEAQVHVLSYRLSAMPTLKEAIAADPSFAMGHCLRGYQMMMFGTFSVAGAVKAALESAEALQANITVREQAHIKALRAWHTGKTSLAVALWERILTDYPLDLLALRLHHFNSFWTGKPLTLRAAPASVLDRWSEDIPGYGNVLGMLAFGYEECGQYREAEKYGRKAVEYNVDDLWALHAVTHVLEMEDRQNEGIAWLTRPKDTWSDRNPFKGHLWWHLALFHLESGKYDAALQLYDESIRNDGSTFYLDIQNAASLLARLHLLGVDLGDRWNSLADFAEQSIGDHALIFTDLHFMIALARTGRFDAANRLLASMEEYALAKDTDNSSVIREVGLELCRGVLAFEQGKYDVAIDHFAPLHNKDASIGASHAQRDIVDQYLIESALRAKHLNKACMLLGERVQLRPRNEAAARKHKLVLDQLGQSRIA